MEEEEKKAIDSFIAIALNKYEQSSSIKCTLKFEQIFEFT